MSALRQIGALDLPNLTPNDLSASPLPMLEWIEIDELWVHPAYQRDITGPSLKLIGRLIEEWDWLKLAPLLVAITENGFEVIDGQTRATAAKLHPQITTVPCYVVDGSTLPERAEAFVSHARSRVAVTPGQIHHAAVTAGDAEAVELDTACRAANLLLLPFSPERSAFKPRQTVAIATIKQIIKRRGAERATDVLRATADAEFAPISADHLKVADALLCGEDFAGEFNVEAVTALLKSISPRTYVEARELAIAKQLPTWRSLVAVLYRSRKVRSIRVVDPAPIASATSESTVDRAPEKGCYRAPAPSTARPIRDRDSAPSILPARPEVRQVVELPGTPPPGRSALDERRRAGA